MAFNRNKILNKAQKLLQKGKVAEAIKEYQQIVDNDPADIRTLLKVGDLQAKLGNSLRELINETEKLIHFVRDRENINVDDVEQLVGISRNYNIFQLWDALGTKELCKSLIILRQMLETGESPVFIVSSLTNYFLRLWRIQELKRKNVDDNGIGKVLHIHPYFLKSIIQQARRYSNHGIKTPTSIVFIDDRR